MRRSIRSPSSMRAAIASGYVNGGHVRIRGGSIGRPSNMEEAFDVSRHRVQRAGKLTKGGEQVNLPYIGEPDPPIPNFDGTGALGIIVPTSGLIFDEKGFVFQQQEQDPPTYIAEVLIGNQEGYFAVGGPARKSDELRIAVGDAGGSRQVVNEPVPEPYNPREVNSVVANNGFVIVSLGV